MKSKFCGKGHNNWSTWTSTNGKVKRYCKTCRQLRAGTYNNRKDDGKGGKNASGDLLSAESSSESVGSQLEKLVQFAEQLGQSAQRLGRTINQTKSEFERTSEKPARLDTACRRRRPLGTRDRHAPGQPVGTFASKRMRLERVRPNVVPTNPVATRRSAWQVPNDSLDR